MQQDLSTAWLFDGVIWSTYKCMSISTKKWNSKNKFYNFSASFKYLLSIKLVFITVFNGSFLISLFSWFSKVQRPIHAVSNELNFSIRSFLWMLLIAVKQVTVIADVDSFSCKSFGKVKSHSLFHQSILSFFFDLLKYKITVPCAKANNVLIDLRYCSIFS